MSRPRAGYSGFNDSDSEGTERGPPRQAPGRRGTVLSSFRAATASSVISVLGLTGEFEAWANVNKRLEALRDRAGTRVSNLKNRLGPAKSSWPEGVATSLEAVDKVRRKLDRLVEEHEKMRAKLGSADEGAVDGLELQMTVLFENINDMCLQTLSDSTIHSLLPHAGAGWHPDSVCNPNTRLAIRDAAARWRRSNDVAQSNTFWVLGPAGYGKTTIAHTVARDFHDAGVLLSCFFFKRSSRTALRRAFSTLAHDLFGRHPGLRKGISQALQANNTLAQAPPAVQFRELIQKPVKAYLEANSAPSSSPLIVVWDGLDECHFSNPEECDALLTIIKNDLPPLSPIMKFFITTRPFAELAGVLQSPQYSSGPSLPNQPFVGISLSPVDNHGDITAYLRYALPVGIASDDQVRALSRKSDGLFLWASRVARLIKTDVDPTGLLKGWLPGNTKKPLTNMTSQEPDAIPSLINLDFLYDSVLRDVELHDFSEAFKDVISVCLAINPSQRISKKGLASLTQSSRSELVIDHLGAILCHRPDGTLCPLHQTFIDYVTSPQRCNPSRYHVPDTPKAHAQLILNCLHVLERGLHPDNFRLKDRLKEPWLLNSELEDLKGPRKLSTLIREHVPSELVYASNSLSYHIKEVMNVDGKIPEAALPSLGKLLKSHLLDWFLLASLLGGIRSVHFALSEFDRRFRSLSLENNLQQLLSDSVRFLDTFMELLNANAQHVYISALVFTPRDSELWRVYGARAPKDIIKKERRHGQWAPRQTLLAATRTRTLMQEERRKNSATPPNTTGVRRAAAPLRISTNVRLYDHSAFADSPVEERGNGVQYEIQYERDREFWVWSKESGKRVLWIPSHYRHSFKCKPGTSSITVAGENGADTEVSIFNAH